ncbi:unnamed protein product [Prunus armeniaca]|uniref:Uncharacterized protein n=1 Tax=Prunus armeniaca TaxID=36596 RepID=A0A6J5XP99_PRUAR|nr:unnamed protein product [Prunus armeniaca]CAB4313932.1 unnamed protein product [Prunus armeniaca]
MARLSRLYRSVGSRSPKRGWDVNVQTLIVKLGLNLVWRWLALRASIIEPISVVGVDSVFLVPIVRGGHEQFLGGERFGRGPFLFPATTTGLRHASE